MYAEIPDRTPSSESNLVINSPAEEPVIVTTQIQLLDIAVHTISQPRGNTFLANQMAALLALSR